MEKLGAEESGSTSMLESGLITSQEAEGSLHTLRKLIAKKKNGLKYMLIWLGLSVEHSEETIIELLVSILTYP